MAEIILRTEEPNKVSEILKEAIETEKLRVRYSLDITRNRLNRFEQKYNISSEDFINRWSAEDLDGKDMEYVEWAGEYQFSINLSELLDALSSIEYVSS